MIEGYVDLSDLLLLDSECRTGKFVCPSFDI